MTKKNKGLEYRQKIENIRAKYHMGYITIDQAKMEVQPILDSLNADGRRIAKKFGRKYTPIPFSTVFR